VQVQDRQGNRQALATLDHAHEVGVLQVVVGFGVAAIAVRPCDDFTEVPGCRTAAAHEVGEVG
jgi:hypothetical protein